MLIASQEYLKTYLFIPLNKLNFYKAIGEFCKTLLGIEPLEEKTQCYRVFSIGFSIGFSTNFSQILNLSEFSRILLKKAALNYSEIFFPI